MFGEDPDGIFYERMFLIEQPIAIINELFLPIH